MRVRFFDTTLFTEFFVTFLAISYSIDNDTSWIEALNHYARGSHLFYVPLNADSNAALVLMLDAPLSRDWGRFMTSQTLSELLAQGDQDHSAKPAVSKREVQ
jgi:hypothetical protein